MNEHGGGDYKVMSEKIRAREFIMDKQQADTLKSIGYWICKSIKHSLQSGIRLGLVILDLRKIGRSNRTAALRYVRPSMFAKHKPSSFVSFRHILLVRPSVRQPQVS